jgi:hypothetical protein
MLEYCFAFFCFLKDAALDLQILVAAIFFAAYLVILFIMNPFLLMVLLNSNFHFFLIHFVSFQIFICAFILVFMLNYFILLKFIRFQEVHHCLLFDFTIHFL